MTKRRRLIGIAFLLLVMFISNSAVAASGASENRSALKVALDQLLAQVADLLGFAEAGNSGPGGTGSPPSPAGTADGDVRSGIDPWG